MEGEPIPSPDPETADTSQPDRSRDPHQGAPAAASAATRSRPCRSLYLAGLCLAALLCFGCPAREPAEQLRIGLIAPLTGALGEDLGHPARLGAKLAIDEANARGGLRLDGRDWAVALLVEDSMDQPEQVMRAARKLIHQDGVVALVGPLLSRNALVAATVAEFQKTPMISPSGTARDLTVGRSFVFRGTFVDDQQGMVLAHFAHGRLGARRAAVLYDVASAHQRDVAEVFQQTFEGLGGAIVASEIHTTGDRDFRSQLERIHSSEPEVLLLPNYVEEVPLQATQARELGITATLLGSDAWSGDLYPTLPVFEGAYFADDWQLGVENLDHERSGAFIDTYQEHYGLPPDSLATLTYDSVGLLLRAIEHAGQRDGEAIRQALANLEDYPGITGNISFQGGGDPSKNVYIYQIREGRLVLAEVAAP